MTPIQKTEQELNNSSMEGLRSELWVHGCEPSEDETKETMIQVLLYLYFGGVKLDN